jgi:hypothetical protein
MIVWAYTNRRYEYQRKKLCRTVANRKSKKRKQNDNVKRGKRKKQGNNAKIAEIEHTRHTNCTLLQDKFYVIAGKISNKNIKEFKQKSRLWHIFRAE